MRSGRRKNRTFNKRIKSPLLCQLSYAPETEMVQVLTPSPPPSSTPIPCAGAGEPPARPATAAAIADGTARTVSFSRPCSRRSARNRRRCAGIQIARPGAIYAPELLAALSIAGCPRLRRPRRAAARRSAAERAGNGGPAGDDGAPCTDVLRLRDRLGRHQRQRRRGRRKQRALRSARPPQYASALTAALACTPGAPNQCQALVANVSHELPRQSLCGGRVVRERRHDRRGGARKWLDECEPAARQPVHRHRLRSVPRPPAPVSRRGPGATTGTCVPVRVRRAGAGDVAARRRRELRPARGGLHGGGDRRARLHARRAEPVPDPRQPGARPPATDRLRCGGVRDRRDRRERRARHRWIAQCVEHRGLPADPACRAAARLPVSCVPNVDRRHGQRTTGTCALHDAPD